MMSEQPHGEMLRVPGAQGRVMDAHYSAPGGTGPFPGVVIIHEIFGLTDNVRDVARRFALAGYAALATDLFSTGPRVVCMLRVMYGILLRPLENDTVADLRAALDFLQARPQVDRSRVGVIGFCMGGSYALQLACVDDTLRAASVFYGQNPRPLDAFARACPIVGSYPERDFTANAARQLEPVLEKYHVPHDIKIYPDAHHSFFNDTRPSYDSVAAEDAWQRTLSFFETFLKNQDANTVRG